MRVLLVDDDVGQLKLCRLRLLNAGFDVEVAFGAEEALAKARRRRPSCSLAYRTGARPVGLFRGLAGGFLARKAH